jgi:hypothetical protein
MKQKLLIGVIFASSVLGGLNAPAFACPPNHRNCLEGKPAAPQTEPKDEEESGTSVEVSAGFESNREGLNRAQVVGAETETNFSNGSSLTTEAAVIREEDHTLHPDELGAQYNSRPVTVLHQTVQATAAAGAHRMIDSRRDVVGLGLSREGLINAGGQLFAGRVGLPDEDGEAGPHGVIRGYELTAGRDIGHLSLEVSRIGARIRNDDGRGRYSRNGAEASLDLGEFRRLGAALPVAVNFEVEEKAYTFPAADPEHEMTYITSLSASPGELGHALANDGRAVGHAVKRVFSRGGN